MEAFFRFRRDSTFSRRAYVIADASIVMAVASNSHIQGEISISHAHGARRRRFLPSRRLITPFFDYYTSPAHDEARKSTFRSPKLFSITDYFIFSRPGRSRQQLLPIRASDVARISQITPLRFDGRPFS